jgi:protein-histidine N-methyltransferase
LTWYFHEAQGHQAEPNGDIEITPEAVEDFQTCLKKQNITLDFYSGSWDTLHEAGAFDQSGSRKSIVLTSETIYSMQSLPTLVNALEMACSGSIESSLQRAALCDATDNGPRKCLCLVAAKVLYFGVGGGVNAFNDELKRRRARSKTVWHSERGVSRLVLQVDFDGAAIDATE